MVFHHVDVCVQSKHVLESSCETLLVQPVGLLANRVDERAVNVCSTNGVGAWVLECVRVCADGGDKTRLHVRVVQG